MPCSGHEKTRGACAYARRASVVVYVSQRRRCLSPPCLQSGRRAVLCDAFSFVSDSLVVLTTCVGAKPKHALLSCQHISTVRCVLDRRILLQSGGRRDAPLAAHDAQHVDVRLSSFNKSACFKHFSHESAHLARESPYPQAAQSWQGAWHAGRPEPRKKLSPARSFSAPRRCKCAEMRKLFHKLPVRHAWARRVPVDTRGNVYQLQNKSGDDAHREHTLAACIPARVDDGKHAPSDHHRKQNRPHKAAGKYRQQEEMTQWSSSSSSSA